MNVRHFTLSGWVCQRDWNFVRLWLVLNASVSNTAWLAWTTGVLMVAAIAIGPVGVPTALRSGVVKVRH